MALPEAGRQAGPAAHRTAAGDVLYREDYFKVLFVHGAYMRLVLHFVLWCVFGVGLVGVRVLFL